MNCDRSTNAKAKILIIICALVYFVSYLTRYSYNSNIVAITDYYKINNATAGFVCTLYFFSYGIGQIVHGLLCKKYNPKYIISFVLAVSAVINIIAFYKPPFFVFKYLWFINGAVLSVLWSLLLKTISDNIPDGLVNFSAVVMSIPVVAGTVVAYGGSALFNFWGNFSISFITSAILAIIIGSFWLFLYDKFVFKSNVSESVSVRESEIDVNNRGKKGFIFLLVLLGIYSAIAALIRDGLNTWMPQILKTEYDFSDSISLVLTLVLPMLGFFGCFLGVFLNKKIKDYVTVCAIIFSIMIVCLFSVILSAKKSFVIMVISFGVLSLLSHTVTNVTTSLFPMKNGGYINSGLVAGLLNGSCYTGSTLSAYGLGYISDKFGWNEVFFLLFSCAVFALLSAIIYIIVKNIKKKRYSY